MFSDNSDDEASYKVDGSEEKDLEENQIKIEYYDVF